jgi:hypothetical protein
VVKVAGNAYRPDLVTVVDVQRAHRTSMTTVSRDVTAGIPAETFTKNKLGTE